MDQTESGSFGSTSYRRARAGTLPSRLGQLFNNTSSNNNDNLLNQLTHQSLNSSSSASSSPFSRSPYRQSYSILDSALNSSSSGAIPRRGSASDFSPFGEDRLPLGGAPNSNSNGPNNNDFNSRTSNTTNNSNSNNSPSSYASSLFLGASNSKPNPSNRSPTSVSPGTTSSSTPNVRSAQLPTSENPIPSSSASSANTRRASLVPSSVDILDTSLPDVGSIHLSGAHRNSIAGITSIAGNPTSTTPGINVSGVDDGNATPGASQGPGGGSKSPSYVDQLLNLRKEGSRLRSFSTGARNALDEPYGPVSTSPSPPPAVSSNAHLQTMLNLDPSRPRARTIVGPGDLQTRLLRGNQPSRLENSVRAVDIDNQENSLLEANELERDIINAINSEIENDPTKQSILWANEQQSVDDSNAASYINTTGPVGATNTFSRQQQPTHDQSQLPTRSLWLGNIPANVDADLLAMMFSPYGTIESARVLSHKNCAFINFESLESAIQAREFLNGRELFPGYGPLRIGFAKVFNTDQMHTPSSSDNNTLLMNEQRGYDIEQGYQHQPVPVTNRQSPPAASSGPSNAGSSSGSSTFMNLAASIPPLGESKSQLLDLMSELGGDEEEVKLAGDLIDRAAAFNSFIDTIPPVPVQNPNRGYDAPKLREIRKNIDNGALSKEEIEEAAMDMLDSIAELSSDYLGNTIVQKLFDQCSEPAKEMMLERIAPYFAATGTHKNGTWAAQKIIDTAVTPKEIELITSNLYPYAVALLSDQFGNYVIQCCLKFGTPYNDFIFQTMLSRFADLAHGRFGSRAIRAVLESSQTSEFQQRLLAAMITLYVVPLATNPNGALLLTWLLDTCNMPNRHNSLVPILLPHLLLICAHKVASITLLKLMTYRLGPDQRQMLFEGIFGKSPDDLDTLEHILSDSLNGANVIYKIITSPSMEPELRAKAVANVKTVLLRINAQPIQGLKRLMEEVGLPVRTITGTTPSTGGTGLNKSQHPQQQHHHHNNRSFSNNIGNNNNNQLNSAAAAAAAMLGPGAAPPTGIYSPPPPSLTPVQRHPYYAQSGTSGWPAYDPTAAALSYASPPPMIPRYDQYGGYPQQVRGGPPSTYGRGAGGVAPGQRHVSSPSANALRMMSPYGAPSPLDSMRPDDNLAAAAAAAAAAGYYPAVAAAANPMQFQAQAQLAAASYLAGQQQQQQQQHRQYQQQQQQQQHHHHHHQRY